MKNRESFRVMVSTDYQPSGGRPQNDRFSSHLPLSLKQPCADPSCSCFHWLFSSLHPALPVQSRSRSLRKRWNAPYGPNSSTARKAAITSRETPPLPVTSTPSRPASPSCRIASSFMSTRNRSSEPLFTALVLESRSPPPPTYRSSPKQKRRASDFATHESSASANPGS